MAQIYSSDLVKELISGAAIQISRDAVPNQLAEKVVPTMEVNPNLLRTINIVRSGTATGSIYTTDSDGDFYLYAIYASITSTTAGVNNANISGQPEGFAAAQSLCKVYVSNSITVDEGQQNAFLSFPVPIKIARGTSIRVDTGGTIASGMYILYGHQDIKV